MAATNNRSGTLYAEHRKEHGHHVIEAPFFVGVITSTNRLDALHDLIQAVEAEGSRQQGGPITAAVKDLKAAIEREAPEHGRFTIPVHPVDDNQKMAAHG